MAAEQVRFAAACGVLLCALSSGLGAGVACAQSTATAVPDTREMIDALKPARQRNLLVRPSAAQAAAAPSVAPAPDPPAAPVTQPAPVMPAPVTVAPTPGPAPTVPPPDVTTEAPPSLSLAIQFDLNSARVRPESGAVLGNLVAAMLSADLRSNRFLIEGHTDARGTAGANKLLSQQRADEVRLFLVALGVHPARLKAVGKGSSEPANPRDPLAADNRRVRVVTLE